MIGYVTMGCRLDLRCPSMCSSSLVTSTCGRGAASRVLCMANSYSYLFVMSLTPCNASILELDRTEGWRMKSFHGSSLARLLQCIVDTNWLWSSAFHLRVLLFQTNGCGAHVCDLLSALPMMFAPFHQRKIVVEISVLPVAWSNDMKQLVTTLAC